MHECFCSVAVTMFVVYFANRQTDMRNNWISWLACDFELVKLCAINKQKASMYGQLVSSLLSFF